MTDHKFTDEEVIKALECFAIDKDFDERQCIGCAFETKGLCCENASEEIAKVTLALINRQKAEIESLKKVLYELKMEAEMVYKQRDAQKNRADSIAKFARAEAIKEFAERLIKKCDAPHWCVWMSEIEDLKEEMTEGQK